MTKREALRQTHQENTLLSLGVSRSDAESLRRISITLHRWHERECGTGDGCIERDEITHKPHWVFFRANGSRGKYSTPDRESGALKQLAKIMAKYPTLTPYVQGDPRGCALYILRPNDVPEGASADSYYSRGIAVY